MGRMRKGAAALAAGLATTLSGCWVQPGFDAGRSHWNAGEATITAATVAGVGLRWDVVAAGAPVATYGSLVYVQDDLVVTALDAATGTTRWRVDLRDHGLAPDATPAGGVAVAGGTLHVPWNWAFRGGLARLDAATGAVIDTDVPTGARLGDPAVRGDRLVAGSTQLMGTSFLSLATIGGMGYTPSFTYPAGPGPGHAFAVVGDRVAWSFGTEATGFSPACPPYPPPAPGLPGPSGCAPDWRTELGGWPVDVAAAGPDRVVFTDDSGTLTVLDAATGAVRWTAEVGAPGPLTVAAGTIFVGTDTEVQALPAAGCGAATCNPGWTLPGVAPFAGGDVVYVHAGDDVLAFPVAGCGASSCAPLATLEVPGTSLRTWIVDGGRVFGTTGDGRVVAFGLP